MDERRAGEQEKHTLGKKKSRSTWNKEMGEEISALLLSTPTRPDFSCGWLLKQACRSWYSGPQTCVTVPRCALHLLPSTQRLNQDICITAAVACVARQPVPTAKNPPTMDVTGEVRVLPYSECIVIVLHILLETLLCTVWTCLLTACVKERETFCKAEFATHRLRQQQPAEFTRPHAPSPYLCRAANPDTLSVVHHWWGKKKNNTHTLWLQTQCRDSVLLSTWARLSVTWYLSLPSIMTGCSVLTQEVKRKDTLAAGRG